MISCPLCRKTNKITIYYNSNLDISCCICLVNVKKNKYSICGDIRHSLHYKCSNKYINRDNNYYQTYIKKIIFGLRGIIFLFIIIILRSPNIKIINFNID
jgi:hypothetical protein